MNAAVERDRLESLIRNAVELAERSQRLEDIERAANITKLVAEKDKAHSEAQNQPEVMRFEYWRSLATLVVPLLTLITLAVTVWMQASQLSTIRDANHDLQWRETVKMVLAQVESKQLELNKTQDSGQPEREDQPRIGREDPILATTLLKSYISDEKYGKDALDLGLLMLSRIPSSEIFKDFYDSMRIKIDWNNLDRVVGANRNIWTQEVGIYQQYRDVIDNPPTGQPAPIVDHYFSLVEEETFLGDKIAQVLRTKRPSKYSLDFSRALFLRCDFSAADLSGANLTGSRFEAVKLSDANLGGVTEFQDSGWSDTDWWNAKAIGPKLLLHLITNAGPSRDGSYAEAPPSETVYVQKVKHLCELAKTTCPFKIPYTWVRTDPPPVRNTSQ